MEIARRVRSAVVIDASSISSAAVRGRRAVVRRSVVMSAQGTAVPGTSEST